MKRNKEESEERDEESSEGMKIEESQNRMNFFFGLLGFEKCGWELAMG